MEVFRGITLKNFRLIIYICVYNPKNFGCMINRELYMEQITPFIDKPFVKVITGIRRCGIKSVVLRLIREEFLRR